jgi:hypothetical protein
METQAQSVRFLAVAKSGASTIGLREITFSLEKKNGVGHVLETISPRRATRSETDKAVFDLLEKAEGLKFSYLQQALTPEMPPVWRTDWREASQLPVAIRVSIQARSKTGSLVEASAIAYLGR